MANGTSLTRPDDRMIGGVIAGLARHFGWPVNRTRLGFVLLSFFSAAFPGIIVYLLLWLVMPDERDPDRRLRLEDPAPRDMPPGA